MEFNKDDGNDGQYIALRFESRDVAKDVYRRLLLVSLMLISFLHNVAPTIDSIFNLIFKFQIQMN